MEDGEAYEVSDDIIESSQFPTLRENVRKNRIFYGEKKMYKSILEPKRQKKNEQKPTNNATVSQCLFKEWKSPSLSKHRNLTTKEGKHVGSVPRQVEEYVKIATQYNADDAIGNNPSVNLFEQQGDVVHRYMFHEETEAQQEEMLDKILAGYRTSYEKANAKLKTSLYKHASPVIETINIPSIEIANEHPNVEPTPEVRRLQQSDQAPDYPTRTAEERDILPLVVDGCLDLSKKGDKKSSKTYSDTYRANDKHNGNGLHYGNGLTNGNGLHNCSNKWLPYNHEEILDLHMCPSRLKEGTNRASEYSSKFCREQQLLREASKCASTNENGTQTNHSLSRNAGVQHRPVASFDMTKYNVISLARMVGSNPDSLYMNLKTIIRTSQRSLWQVRNLSHVFTHNDPYYANFELFMSPRL